MTWATENITHKPHYIGWVIALIILIIIPIPAMAANAFLLQLGTSDSESAAKQKWEDLKTKNSDVLSGLNLHIAEVVLPPKDTTSYRTQAGPVASRAQAAQICSTLKERDLECYVVETALLASEIAPTPAETKPEEATEEKPKPFLDMRAAKAEKHEDTAEADAHADDPDYVPPPSDSGPIIIGSHDLAAPSVVASAPSPKNSEVEEETHAPVTKTATTSTDHYIRGREPHFLDEHESAPATVAAAEIPAESPQPMAPQTAAPKESRGFFSRLFGSKPPKPSDSEGVTGNVNVAEAVPVPLSSGEQPVKEKIVPTLPEVNGLGGTPSSPTDKTLWAQISYFQDETQALNFYRQFSAAYPQYTDGVRIRITKPFTATTATGKVSLRVGPFLGNDDVSTICEAAAKWNAHCTTVREIGSTTTSKAGTHSPRGIRAAADTSHGSYWAQLGSYTSQQEAWDTWNDLKSTHAKLVKHARPSVSPPPLSSAEQTTYRLRAGPYTSESAANNFCTHLQAIGTDCIVVNDR